MAARKNPSPEKPAPESAPEAGEAKPPMKRSRYVALAALGIVGTSFFFSGKQKPAEDDAKASAAVVYANAEDCVRANVLGRDTCEAEFRKAQTNYAAQAPKYSAKDGCEAAYGAGQCQQSTYYGNPVFVPLMAGFMVGNYLSNARNAQALYPPRAGSVACAPGSTPENQPGCIMPRSNTSNSSTRTSSSWSTGWSSYSTHTGDSVSRTNAGNGTTTVPGHVARGFAAGSSRSGSSASHSSTVSRGGFGSTAHSVSSRSGS